MTWPEWFSWTNVEQVRKLLAAGADPHARLHALRNTPLHNALSEFDPSAEVVRLLISHGADVEAVNTAGETPLWCAVRRGCEDDVAQALLDAGAQPWRPVLSGRSAGRMALDGPLLELFENLPGAPEISQAERDRQAEADSLIESYSELSKISPYLAVHLCVAFVGGATEDEVIRRAGADQSQCPVLSVEQYKQTVDGTGNGSALWVGTVPTGGVVIYELMGITPVYKEFLERISVGGAIIASTFDNPAGGDQRVNMWRDGVSVGWPSPYNDPRENDPPEAWLCRFGDFAHGSSDIARNLALMALLTGTRPDPTWLFEAPKRFVKLP